MGKAIISIIQIMLFLFITRLFWFIFSYWIKSIFSYWIKSIYNYIEKQEQKIEIELQEYCLKINWKVDIFNNTTACIYNNKVFKNIIDLKDEEIKKHYDNLIK